MDNQANNNLNKPVAKQNHEPGFYPEPGFYSKEDLSLLQDKSPLPGKAETTETNSVSPEDAALLADQSGIAHPSQPQPQDTAMVMAIGDGTTTGQTAGKQAHLASSTMSPNEFEKWAGQLWQQYFASEAKKIAEQQLQEYQNGQGTALIGMAIKPVEETLLDLRQRLEPLEKLPQSLTEVQTFCHSLSQQFKELPTQMADAVQQEFVRFWEKEEARFQEILQLRIGKIEEQLAATAGQARLPQEEWASFWRQEEQRMQDSFQERFARVDTQLAQLASQIGNLEANLREFDNRCKELGDKSTSNYQSAIAEWWQQEEKRLQHGFQERIGKLDGQLAQFPSQVKELVHKEASGLWQKEEKQWHQREEQNKSEIQQLHTQTDRIDNTLRREFEKLSQYLQTLQQKESLQKQQVKELEDALQLKLKNMEKVYVDLEKKTEAHSIAQVSRSTFGWTVALLFIGYLAVLVLLLAK